MAKLVFFIAMLFSVNTFYGQFDSSNKKVKFGIVPDKNSNKKAEIPLDANKKVTPSLIEFESNYLNKKEDDLYKSYSNIPKVGENTEKKQYEVKSTSDLYTEKLKAKLSQEGITREIVNSDMFLGEYTVYTNEIDISARDYGAIDGDLVRIWLNGEILYKQISLESGFKNSNFKLKEGLNIIHIEALNIGLAFPNTGQFTFIDGNGKIITEQFWGLNQGYRAIIKVYKKKGLEEDSSNK